MYDYYLGGKDNFAADRDAAEAVLSAAPEVRMLARENRAFLIRAVRYLAEQGVTQILDIGTGIPTSPNVHEVARSIAPETRIVYVDNDPIVLAHNRALRAADGVACIRGDMRDPATFADDPVLHDLIDFDRPVAVLFASVLHFMTDAEDPHAIVGFWRDRIVPGSYLLVSHITGESRPTASADAASAYTTARASSSATLRSRADIQRLFDGFTLVDPPGRLVYLPEWHPDDPGNVVDPELVWMLAGVGRRV
jgi:hypothetical protein